MKNVLIILVVSLFCVSTCFAVATSRRTALEVTEVELINDFLVVCGVTNDVDLPQTESASIGTRVFVNGFMTHTHPSGGWKICIPASTAEFDESKGYKLEVYAYDISCAASIHKVLYVKAKPTSRRARVGGVDGKLLSLFKDTRAEPTDASSFKKRIEIFRSWLISKSGESKKVCRYTDLMKIRYRYLAMGDTKSFSKLDEWIAIAADRINEKKRAEP